MAFSAFQNNAFQDNAFQIYGGGGSGAFAPEIESLPWLGQKPRKKEPRPRRRIPVVAEAPPITEAIPEPAIEEAPVAESPIPRPPAPVSPAVMAQMDAMAEAFAQQQVREAADQQNVQDVLDALAVLEMISDA